MTVTPVRLLRKADLPRVLAIEAEANPMPWREGDFLPFVAPAPEASHPAAGAGGPAAGAERWRGGALKVAWVYEDKGGGKDGAEGGDDGGGRGARAGETLGFACASAVADEVELQSLAVERGSRGRGIGSALLEALVEWARESGFRTLHLEVRAGNRPALGLYRRFGFAQAGIRPGYYQDNGEDALLLTREIGRPGQAPDGRAATSQDC
jgi:ribosomal-protein-alanine acetyltransferase